MSVVGGTQGYVTGQIISVGGDCCCDNHSDMKATKRVVGEVDNFGFEASDFCEHCFIAYTKINEVENKECDVCGCGVNHLRPIDDLKMCDICVSKIIHSNEVENNDNHHGVECILETEDSNDYRYQMKNDDVRKPLNFDNPKGRW